MKKFTAVLISALIASLALAAPVFSLSKDPKMNLMTQNDIIQLAAYPQSKLTYWHINRSKATFIFQSMDIKELYDFYDKALGAEGWKDAPMMGMENGILKDGSYAGTYAMEEYTLSFSVKAAMGKTTVHFEVR